MTLDFNDRYPVAALRQDFECDFDIGKIVRKVAAGGQLAGVAAFLSVNIDGYLVGCWRYRKFLSHRVVWALAYGQWPDRALHIDHIDRCKTNNALRNLRIVTNVENQRNISAKRILGGPLGLDRIVSGKWRVKIRLDGRLVHLGCFSDICDAVAARYAAEVQHGWPHLGVSLHDRQQQALAYVAGLDKAD